MDIANESAPVVLKSTIFPAEISTSVVSGNLMYVADFAQGIYAYDFPTPAKRTLKSIFSQTKNAASLIAEGALLYASYGYDSRFGILDYNDPAKPALLSSIELVGATVAMMKQGNNVFVLGDSLTLESINVSNPLAPVKAGALALPWKARGMCLSPQGNYLYIAMNDDGANSLFAVIDIGVPASPVIKKTVKETAPYLATSVAASGSLLYTLSYKRGFPSRYILSMYDITDPSTPVWKDSIGGKGEAGSLVARDSMVYAGIPGGSLHSFYSGLAGRLVADAYFELIDAFLNLLWNKYLLVGAGETYYPYGKTSAEAGEYVIEIP